VVHIAAVLLALTLLYFWLIGHWFARILMLPVFFVVCGLGSMWLYVHVPEKATNLQILVGGFGVFLSTWVVWEISAAPTRYWHRRSVFMAAEQSGMHWPPVRD
jgi:uncharacterized membrane protein (DUF485 family)